MCLHFLTFKQALIPLKFQLNCPKSHLSQFCSLHPFICHSKVVAFFFQAIEYDVGDILELLPDQNPALVDAFIERCNLDPDAFITVSGFSFAFMGDITLP